MSRWSAVEERSIKAAEFALDLALQLYSLREQRGLSQAELAELVGTKQQAISRLENPMYERQSLAKLREIAEALNAYVDVTLVPEEKVNLYMEARYQPVLNEAPPVVVGEAVRHARSVSTEFVGESEGRGDEAQRFEVAAWDRTYQIGNWTIDEGADIEEMGASKRERAA